MKHVKHGMIWLCTKALRLVFQHGNIFFIMEQALRDAETNSFGCLTVAAKPTADDSQITHLARPPACEDRCDHDLRP